MDNSKCIFYLTRFIFQHVRNMTEKDGVMDLQPYIDQFFGNLSIFILKNLLCHEYQIFLLLFSGNRSVTAFSHVVNFVKQENGMNQKRNYEGNSLKILTIYFRTNKQEKLACLADLLQRRL